LLWPRTSIAIERNSGLLRAGRDVGQLLERRLLRVGDAVGLPESFDHLAAHIDRAEGLFVEIDQARARVARAQVAELRDQRRIRFLAALLDLGRQGGDVLLPRRRGGEQQPDRN
jgi:hypothetical protein